MTRRLARWAVLGATLALVAAGCDSGGGGGGSIAAFCGIAEELDSQEGEPSASQIDQAVDAAPSEIKDDVRTLAEALEKVGDDPEAAAELFTSEDVIAAGTRVEEFQAENCDGGDDDAPADEDGDGDEEGADDAASGTEADLERFCEIANSEREPDAETMSEWISVAPSDIAPDVGVVLDSVLAEQNGTEPSFSEEDIAESTANIDEFIAENC